MIGNVYKVIDRGYLHRIAVNADKSDVLRIILEFSELDAVEYEVSELSSHIYTYYISKENTEEEIYFFTTLPISADIQVD